MPIYIVNFTRNILSDWPAVISKLHSKPKTHDLESYGKKIICLQYLISMSPMLLQQTQLTTRHGNIKQAVIHTRNTYYSNISTIRFHTLLWSLHLRPNKQDKKSWLFLKNIFIPKRKALFFDSAPSSNCSLNYISIISNT